MKLLIDRPILTMMIFLLVVILGIYSLLNLPLELLPEIKMPRLFIQVIWPGASADLILNRAVLPIEEEISALKEVKKLTSESAQDRAEIEVELDKSLNLDLAYILIKERINRLKNNLPPQIQSVEVTSYVPDELRLESFMQFSVSSSQVDDINLLRLEFERDVLPRLKSVFGIKEVRITGGADVSVKIIPDFQKMELRRVNLRTLYYALQRNFVSLPSVRIRNLNQEIILNLTNQPSSLRALADLIINSDQRNPVRLSDVALVSFGYCEQNQEARLNGQAILNVDLIKQPYISSLTVEHNVARVFAEIAKYIKAVICLKLFRAKERKSAGN